MCFSATASFAAAALTGAAGAVTLRAAPRSAYRWVAGIPVLFALHQFAEGVLWLSLGARAPAAWADPAMFAYLTVAKVVWPTWVPLAIRALEPEPRRRRALTALLALGVVLSVAEAYSLATYPVSAGIGGRHVAYEIATPPVVRWPTDLAYLATTVAPPLVSSSRTVRRAGLAVLLALLVSKVLYYRYFASVWCFFAALISVGLVLALHATRRAPAAVRAAS
jgi:hypothetical protein